MSCSIHLGNYILVVQQPHPEKKESSNMISVGTPHSQRQPTSGSATGKSSRGAPSANQNSQQNNKSQKYAVSTAMAQQDMGALDFELSWLRFLRDTEEEYQKRLARNDKSQPLSIFEVNVDLHENYLLKVSGRALAATQHLNLNLTSAMGSHLKIFDTSVPEEPSEFEIEMEAEDELERRRNKRRVRLMKKRRITASFHGHVANSTIEVEEEGEPEQEEVPIQQEEAPIKHVRIHDTLNERDDIEDSAEGETNEKGLRGTLDGDEGFDVNDRSQTITISQEQMLLLQKQMQNVVDEPYKMIDDAEVHEDHNQGTQIMNQKEEQKDDHQLRHPVQQHQEQPLSQTLRDFRTSQLYPDSIIQTEEDPNYHHYDGKAGDQNKIMIGDQSIDENFQNQTIGADGQPAVHHYNDDDFGSNEDYLEGGNPFRRNSANYKEQSIISQGSVPFANVTQENLQISQNFIPAPNDQFNITQEDFTKKGSFNQMSLEEGRYPSMAQVGQSSEQMKQSNEEVTSMIEKLDQKVMQPERSASPHVLEVDMDNHQEQVEVKQINIEPPIVVSKILTPPPMIDINIAQTPVVKQTAESTLIEEVRPTTAQEIEIQVKHSDVSPAIIEVKKPEVADFALQASFRDETQQRPMSPPEQQIIMRFEVAVGTSPRNQSRAQSNNNSQIHNKTESHKDGSKVEIEEIGGEEQQENNMEVSVGIDSNFQVDTNGEGEELQESSIQRREDSPDRGSQLMNNSLDKNPSRLEVTLTAEPDKPIIVEVRGGEKQFLISALTKHIYEILSQPHRLQIAREEYEEQQEGNSAEREDQQEQEEVEENTLDQQQFTTPQQIKTIKLGKNINLKLKSLKKNLSQKNNLFMRGITPKNNLTDQASGKSVLPLSAQKNAITIEEFDQSSKLEEDQIPPFRQSNIHNVQTPVDQKQSMLSLNGKSSINKQASSRSNSGIPLSPLTHSVTEDQKELSKVLMPPQNAHMSRSGHGSAQRPKRNTDREFMAPYDYLSKRTTEEAYADAKIREEIRLTQIFDSNGAHGSMLGRDIMSSHVQEQDGKEIRANEILNQNSNNKRDSNFIGVPDEILAQQLKSRPETANFNQEPQTPSELPPINMKSSQLSNRLLEIQGPARTPKYQQNINFQVQNDKMRLLNSNSATSGFDEGTLYTEKPRYSRRAVTPEGMDENAEFNTSQPSAAEVDQFSLPPLQPTIPVPHPNGYFQQSENGEYIMLGRQDSNNLVIHPGYNGQDEYIGAPQVNYYDGSVPQLENQYYHYQNVGPEGIIYAADQDDLLQNGIPEGEYILAEGYLLHLKKGQTQVPIRAEIIDKQVYDMSRNQPKMARTQAHFNTTKPSMAPVRRQAPFSEQRNSQNMYPPQAPQRKTPANSKLPIVNNKKRIFAHSQNHTNTIYSLNGGPAFRTMPYTPARSLSPLRKKNNVYYTSNFSHQQSTIHPQVQAFNGPQQLDDLGYFTNSPHHGRVRHSPYLSDDEFKILHDYYDIQCEPTGLQRGGVPLMRVKRINRPKQKTYNMFNFTAGAATADETQQFNGTIGSTTGASIGIPKTLSSLQIFYPHYQPSSPFKQEYLMARTLGTPNKWFDRFYQSTRNLNQTISNLHKQHSRKLRSYSVTSLSSGVGEVIHGLSGMQAEGGVADLGNSALVRGSTRELQPLFVKPQFIDAQREVPSERRYQQADLATTSSTNQKFKKPYQSVKSVNGGAVFMPPLQKIYTGNNYSQDQLNGGVSTGSNGNFKKNKLPPRPTNTNTTGTAVVGSNVQSQQSKIGKNQNQLNTSGSGAAPGIVTPVNAAT